MTNPLVNPTPFRSFTLKPQELAIVTSEAEALCVEYVKNGQDYWFGDEERALTAKQVYKAKEICLLCPLRTECRILGASISPAPYGVWGGKRFR